MHVFLHTLRFHFMQLLRQRGQLWQTAGFLVMVVMLFPFALGAEPQLLQTIGAGVVWVAVFLAVLLPINLYFDDDYRDGTLEVLAMKYPGLEGLVLAKILMQWLALWALTVLMLPILYLMVNMPLGQVGGMVWPLGKGILSLCCLGALAAALTLGLRQRQGLAYVLLLPLMVPALMFNVVSTSHSAKLNDSQTELLTDAGLLSTGLLLFLVPLCVWLTAAALRLSVQRAA